MTSDDKYNPERPLTSEDVTVVPKEIALWTDVKEKAEQEILATERIYFNNITFNKAVVELAKSKLDELNK